jgi:hypothetical protein
MTVEEIRDFALGGLTRRRDLTGRESGRQDQRRPQLRDEGDRECRSPAALGPTEKAGSVAQVLALPCNFIRCPPWD